MAEEIHTEDIEFVTDAATLDEIECFSKLLFSLEEVGLNMFPNKKTELQDKLIKLIEQRLENFEYEFETDED